MSNSMQVVPMTQQAVGTYGDRSLTAGDIQAQVNLMQDVMRSTMRDGTHYGTIPGTKSKSLFKAGAEKLMATFRLACIPEVDDLSAGGEVHYRVTVKVYSSSNALLGAGIGECSSQEDKYAWRAAVCEEEFEVTPENRKRVKFAKWNNRVEKKQQVRTNPADVANTILKMAKKRAQVDAVITVTAASDIFTQDIEDLPEELREQIAGQNHASAGNAAVQQTIKEGPERDAADKEASDVSALGRDKFLAMWQAWPKEKRQLVADLMPKYQKAAEDADKEVAE
jgi:hypothetical protein